MKKINLQRGFTLIELLVVIAIIGILSAVVLASLNTARNKGANAAIKSNLANSRAQAEVWYDANGTYAGVCSQGAGSIYPMLLGAQSSSGATTLVYSATANATTTAGTTTSVVCHENIGSTGAWAASAPLKTAEGSNIYWCVDSTGLSAGRINPLAGSVGSQFNCPSS